jgi:hypothetical protein
VKQAIEDAAAGGGLIICSSNSLHPGVDPENCIAMFEATRKYGVYGRAVGSGPGRRPTSGERAPADSDGKD